METPDEKIILAALTVLSIGAGVANAQLLGHSAPPQQQNNSLPGGG